MKVPGGVHADSDEIVAWMVEKKVRRYRFGDFTIELADSAFSSAPPARAPVSDAEVAEALGLRQERSECSCGHDLNVEHSDTGCLLGCSEEVCLRTKDLQTTP